MYPGTHRIFTKNIDDYLRIGWYHLFLVVVNQIFTTSCLTNMGFMAFGGLEPTLSCSNVNQTLESKEICEIIANGMCQNLTLSAEFYSIAMEWNLICDQANVLYLITTVQMLGVLVGAPTFGQISDLFGRKWTYVFSLSCLLVLGAASAFSPDPLVFVIFRFFIGFFVGGEITVFYVYMSELIPNRHRVWMLSGTGAPASYVMFAWLAYFCRDWRTLSWFNSVYPLPLLLIFCIVAKESPRWLIQKGKLQQARESTVSINKWTCRNVDGDALKLVIEREAAKARDIRQGKRHSFWHLFYTWTLVRYTAILALAWFTTSCVSYGILFNSGKLAGSIYINITFYGLFRWAVSIIMSLLDVFVKKVGRKIIHTFAAAVMSLLTFTNFILTFFDVDKEYTEVIRYLNLGCAALLSALWAMIYLVAAELYPTPIRNIGNSFCSVFARIGGAVAPQVLYLNHFWKPATYLFYCVFLVLETAGFLLVLPETKGTPMPEHMPDKRERICYKEPKYTQPPNRPRTETGESGTIRSESFFMYRFEDVPEEY